jgi:hypothetical protein
MTVLYLSGLSGGVGIKMDFFIETGAPGQGIHLIGGSILLARNYLGACRMT